MGLHCEHEKFSKEVIDEFSQAITGVVQLVIAMAPFGIAGLVFDSVASTGLAGLTQYGRLLFLLVGTMLVVDLVVYPLVAFVLIRQNPYPLVWFCLKKVRFRHFSLAVLQRIFQST